MNLKDVIKHMQKGVKRNRVIIINQDVSSKYLDEISEISLEKVDVSLKLAEILSGLPLEVKENESWDLLKEFLESLNKDILVLENLDYIFSPEVGNINPVENFNYYSRNNQLIIMFLKARKIGNDLIYSEEGLPDYNRMDISQNKFVLGWEDEN